MKKEILQQQEFYMELEKLKKNKNVAQDFFCLILLYICVKFSYIFVCNRKTLFFKKCNQKYNLSYKYLEHSNEICANIIISSKHCNSFMPQKSVYLF